MISALAALLLASLQPVTADPSGCTAQRAQRVTVEQIARRPERYYGRCVTVSGPVGTTAIYSGVEGIYLAHRSSTGHTSGPPASLHRIGLYARNNAIRARQTGRPPERMTVTGIVDSCERMEARADVSRGPDDVLPILLGGYCHWTNGPVVSAASFQVNPAVRYERLAGEAARRRYGNIRPAPPNWPHLPELRAFASEFLTALRAGDRAALAALHDTRPDTTHIYDSAVLAYLLTDATSPFAEIRRGPMPQMAIFVPTAPQSFAVGAPGTEPEGIICFCRTSDCGDRWPIFHGDSENAADKPYACTSVQPADWLPRKAQMETWPGRAWLMEPRRTAFRRPSESFRR